MIDLLLRQWLQNAAKQRIMEAAQRAASEQMAGAASATGGDEAETREPAKQRPCDVGLVFALGIEAGGLEDRLSGGVVTQAGGFRFVQGGLEGRHIVLVESGAGQQAAGNAAAALIEGHHPRWIVSAGFAGGLQPQLKRGDFLMANGVANLAGQSLGIDLHLSAENAPPGVHVGKLLTVDHIIRLPAEKRSLGEQHAALAVDMETYCVAEVCRREKTRFLAVRVISDAMDDELPKDVDRLVRKKTKASQWGAAVGAIVNRPSSLKDMLKLKEDALVGTDRLAKFLSGVIAQLAE